MAFNRTQYFSGFTLVELLICLVIIGEIATFAIPKIIGSQQNQKNNAIAKEVMGSLAIAHKTHQMKGLLSSNTRASDFLQYFNYVALDTSSNVDQRPGGPSHTCTVSTPCIRLHNGALLYFTNEYFGGTGTYNAVWIHLDADGVYTGNIDAAVFVIYYNGRITSRANTLVGTIDNGYSFDPGNYDPPWLSF